MAKPMVALVGRPNVGKSTLFNRLTGQRVAIVEHEPGITRDRLYGEVEWQGRKFALVDTGGIQNQTDPILVQVVGQAKQAMEDADLILFMVDAREGLCGQDEEVAELLRRTQKPVLLVVNKVDNFDDPGQTVDFFKLGLGEPLPISAAHGLNTGDLLDQIMAILNPTAPEETEDSIAIAVIGRPNVGKSSLVNRLLKEERVITGDLPGTTRDAVDIRFNHQGQDYVLIDTAGLRRRARIKEGTTERYSVIRSLRAVERSDVVLMLLDAQEGVTEQDKKIAGYARETGKAMLILVNKWDLIEKDSKTAVRFEKMVRQEMAFVSYAPVLFISALTGQRLDRVMELVNVVAEEAQKRVPTGELNRMLNDAFLVTPPPTDKGRRLKLFYAHQGGIKPPTFVLFVNDPELVHFSYRRFLENQLREAYTFIGNPLNLIFKPRNAPKE